MAGKLIGLDGLPSLRELRCFALAVEHGSIGRAADEIGMSQPAASHAIARLETRLGTELLVRSSGGSAASHAGERFAVRTSRFLALLKQALLAASSDVSLHARLLHGLRMVHLRAHIAVAETGSFTQAARALGISAPALHRAARELENLLRLRLYRVGEDGIGVNAVGDALAQQMGLAVRELLQGFEEIGHRQADAPAQIAIGVLPLMPKRWIARVLAQTKDTYPDARVEIRERDFSDLLKDLKRGTIDVVLGGFFSDYSGPESDIVQEPVFTDRFVLVVRQGHPLSGTRRIEPAMLARHEWIVPTGNVPRRLAIERFFATLPARPKVWLTTTSVGTMWAVLAETDCIALVSRTHLLMDGPRDLSVLPIDVPHGDRIAGLYKRKNWLPTPMQQRFLKAVSETPVASAPAALARAGRSA